MTPQDTFFSFLPKWKVTDEDCGVITASDKKYFPGLQFLLDTITPNVSVCVVDLGLTAYQRHYLAANKVQIVRCPLYPVTKEAQGTSWLKPWWIRQSPFKYTLWLDSDILVVNDLTPLFQHIKEQVLMIHHPYAEKAPLPFHYKVLQTNPVTKPNGKNDVINAGVLGFADRQEDNELMDAWQSIINEALVNDRLRSRINYWDEGALHWAVAKTGLQNRIVRDKHGWDRFIYLNHCRSPDDMYRRMPIQDGDVIMHFVGQKPWLYWSTYMPQ